MRLLRSAFIAVITVATTALPSAGGDALLTLILPATPVVAGATIRVDLVGLNPGFAGFALIR